MVAERAFDVSVNGASVKTIRVVLTGPRTYSASAAVSDLNDVVATSGGADVVSMSGGAWEDCFTPTLGPATRLSASWWAGP